MNALDVDRFAQMCARSWRTPEERLCLAVFERALRDFIGTTERVKDAHGYRFNGVSPQDRQTAKRYIFDDDFYDGPYEMETVAQILGWDVDALRSMCRRAYQRWHGKAYKHQPKGRRP